MNVLDLRSPDQRTLPAILAAQAKAIPDDVFLMTSDERSTFGEVHEVVERIAAGLAAHGLKAGDRVAILMESGTDYVRVVLAVARAGGIWVPINSEYRGAWLAESVADSIPAMIVVTAENLPRLMEIWPDLPPMSVVVAGSVDGAPEGAVSLDDLRATESRLPAPAVASGDVTAILWTSGTTGKPKGVMQSHNAWVNAAESGNRNFETREGDVVYSPLPLYNSAAWAANIFRAMVAGISVAIDPHFSVTQFWPRIRAFGATQIMSVGAMHMFVWNQPERPDDKDNLLRIGAFTPLPEHLVEPFCTRFGLEKTVQGYGQSEVMTLIGRAQNPGEPCKFNSLGKVNADFELRMIDDDGQDVPIGSVGEFAVRARKPHIMFEGYFNNPEATADAWIGGWYRTGDLGMLDADGDYFFVDRKKDYIRYKGRSVSSFQIERVAAQHPSIASCAAFGVPCRELESEAEIKLDVVLKEAQQFDPVGIARFVNDKAPYFIVPRFIEVRDALPLTPTGKVEKYKLRDLGLSEQTWDREAAGFDLKR